MTDIQPVTPTAHLTYGTDLNYVLEVLDVVDPIDAESEDPSDTDWEVHKALNYVRAQITRRKAVQTGPRTDVDYCGVDDNYGRACGPDLGLPPCGWHGRVGTPAGHTATAAALAAANPKE